MVILVGLTAKLQAAKPVLAISSAVYLLIGSEIIPSV